MLGRRGVNRRYRQYQDRDLFFTSHATHQLHHPFTPITSSPASKIQHHNRNKNQPSSNLVTVTFSWPDPDGKRPTTVLVASFDNFLHHRMHPNPHLQVQLPTDLIVILPVPPGRHTYKFLVNGRWTTHPALHSQHPIEMSEDGVKHHVIVVEANPPPLNNAAPLRQISEDMDNFPDSYEGRIEERDSRQHSHSDLPGTVFRSASASAISSIDPETPTSMNAMRPAIAHSSNPFRKPAPASLPDTSRPTGAHYMAPRGSSFNAPPPSPTPPTLSPQALSQIPVEQRRSILQRVGSGWLRRFSNRLDIALQNHCEGLRPHSAIPSPSNSLSASNFPTPDRSGSGIFRSLKDPQQSLDSGLTGAPHNFTLFASSSEPVVSRSQPQGEEKENARTYGFGGIGKNSAVRSTSGAGMNSERRRMPLRGSSRNTAVKVSGPTRVDEPRDIDEVNRQADNWRQMARHLQDNLHDPAAARELFEKAIAHREKHGLECSTANAQVHTDLARNLSKADFIPEAEMHLRVGLGIYSRLGMGSEHIADLKLYVGVMVDRQKRRQEAEDLYKQALDMYKRNGVKGNNRNIAIKNLVLNLRKQSRLHEIPMVYVDYGRCE